MTSHVIRPWRNTKILREHGSVIVHSIFACLTLSLSTTQAYMIKERCWFSPNQLLYWVLFHIGSRFSFQPILCPSTYTDKNNPFFTMNKETFPIWNFLPAHVTNRSLGFHVVIGVGRLIIRFHHAHVIPSFLLDFGSPTLSCHRQLRTVAIILACCTSRKRGPWRCCPHTPVGYSICNKSWILESQLLRFSAKELLTTGLAVLSQDFACLFLDFLNL